MKKEKFIQLLVSEGFPEPIEVVRDKNSVTGPHSHAFEAKAFILEGQIDIVINNQRSVYLAGDIFHILANQIHSESYGSKGVKYLVGRKE